MGGVWELDLPAPQKIVLLALADHADHEGRNVRPSLDLVAWKTGYSPRQVQRVVHELTQKGILRIMVEGGGRGNPTHYAIDLTKGDKLAPFRKTKGDIYDAEKVTSEHVKGDIYDIKGDIAMSPEPSEPPIEPPIEPTPIVPAEKTAPKKPTYAPEFEEFWRAYPAGGNKKRAGEQWDRLRPDADVFLAMMAGLDRWTACERWREGYVVHAERWIRDRWWENDPPPPKHRQNGRHAPTSTVDRSMENARRVMERMGMSPNGQQEASAAIDARGVER
jgi:hypothetical protein